MKKLANRHLAIVLCFLMMFTFVPVFGDSAPADAGTANKEVIQNTGTGDFTVESQHLWPHHWFKKSQPAPKGLDAIAPTSAKNNDGKITGTNRAMEYKMLTEMKFKPVKGHVIKGLAAGTYQVRYKARPGYWPSPVVTGDVPAYAPAHEKPEAPVGLKGIAPTSAENKDGKITGTDAAMEYVKKGERHWIPATEPEITALTPGVYLVRCAATANGYAGYPAFVMVPAYHAQNQEQDAPEGLLGVAPTSMDNDDGKITGTTTAMEYMMEGEETWTPATAPEITGLPAGMYHVRYAAKDGYNAGAHAMVTVPAYNDSNQEQDAPEGLMGVAPTTDANDDGKITGTTTAMEYQLHTDSAYTPVTGTEITGLEPGMYHVRYAAKEGWNASPHAMVTVPATHASKQVQYAGAGLAGVAPTSEENNDGKITGTTTAMEYIMEDGETWTAATAPEITGLAAGLYQVRYAAKEGYNAGAPATVEVPEFAANQEQDAPEGLAGVAPTTIDNADGKITGTTATMEYMLEGEDIWTTAPAFEIEGLIPATYHVRYAAREGYNASEHTEVIVPEYEEAEEM